MQHGENEFGMKKIKPGIDILIGLNLLRKNGVRYIKQPVDHVVVLFVKENDTTESITRRFRHVLLGSLLIRL